MLKQQPPQMHVVCDYRGPAGDAAILLILHPGQENTHGRVFKPLLPRPPHLPSLRGAVLRLGIHRCEYYEGLVSIVSDDIGSGKGWVGVEASQPIYTSREEPQRCRGCAKAKAGSTKRHNELLSPFISQNICCKAQECGKKNRNNEQLQQGRSRLRYFILPTGI